MTDEKKIGAIDSKTLCRRCDQPWFVHHECEGKMRCPFQILYFDALPPVAQPDEGKLREALRVIWIGQKLIRNNGMIKHEPLTAHEMSDIAARTLSATAQEGQHGKVE